MGAGLDPSSHRWGVTIGCSLLLPVPLCQCKQPSLDLFLPSLANKLRRVELSTASLLKVAPADEERKIVHNLFLNTLDTKYDPCWCWLVFGMVFQQLLWPIVAFFPGR